jgi:hypothetical protein
VVQSLGANILCILPDILHECRGSVYQGFLKKKTMEGTVSIIETKTDQKMICIVYSISGCHNRCFEKFCLLRYQAMWSVQNQPTFRRKISLPSSR